MIPVNTKPLRDVRVLADGLEFPEGPIAMADGSVLVVEIVGGRLTRVAADGTKTTVAEVGDGPNGAAIGPDGNVYICNNGGMSPGTSGRGRIQKVILATGEVTDLYTECDDRKLVAPNDIVFDPTGNFWFTDFGGDAIYYAGIDGASIKCVIPHVDAPNGIGISPDGRTLYWAETHTRMVQRREITAPGILKDAPGAGVSAFFRTMTMDEWSLVVGLPNSMGLDSLAIDANGHILVGTLLDSGITDVDPDDGTFVLRTLPAEVADRAVTNICFGGPDMKTAYLTLSISGKLISCSWDTPGLPLEFNA